MSRIRLFICRCIALAAIAAIAATSVGAPALAQQAKAPLLAIIDVQKVLRESVAVKSLTIKIEAERKKYQQELRTREDSLRAADQELTRQRTILSTEAYTQKRQELEQQVGQLQRQVQERKKGLDQIFGKGMSQVQNELANVAKEIAEERGLDLILSRATVVIVKPEFDLSNEALKRLNARLTTVTPPTQQN
ncbi:MAG: OmpH family outer membrane protein [Alphaproteobacteria bacterium]